MTELGQYEAELDKPGHVAGEYQSDPDDVRDDPVPEPAPAEEPAQPATEPEPPKEEPR